MHCPPLSNISFPNNTEHAKLKDDTENIKLKNSTKHAKLKTKLWKMSHKVLAVPSLYYNYINIGTDKHALPTIFVQKT